MKRVFTSLRRRVIATVLIPAIMLLPLLLLAGCSGGSGDASSGIRGVRVAGSVDAAAFGAGAVSVRSAWMPDPAAVRDGAFTVTVSNAGAQLLFLQDAAGAVRGLAVHVPPAPGARDAGIAFTAESTALALLLLTPGILTADRAEVLARQAEIRGYASFAPFVAYLQSALATHALTAFASGDDAQFDALSQAVLADWLAQHPITVATRNVTVADVAVEPPPEGLVGCMEVQAPDRAWPDVPVQVNNGGFRYVDVRQKTVMKDGTASWDTVATTLKVFPAMPGAAGFSVGSLFTASMFEPTARNRTVSFAGVDHVEYWIYGPGARAGSVTAPDDLPAGAGFHTWGLTIVYYALLPLISLISGVGDLVKKGGAAAMDTAEKLWNALSKVPDSNDEVNTLIESEITVRGTINAIVTLATLLVGTAVFAELLGILLVAAGVSAAAAPPIVAGVGTALIAISATLAAVNVGVMVGYFVRLPRLTCFKVREFAFGLVLDVAPTRVMTGADHAAVVTVTARKYAAGQDPAADAPPAGEPVNGARVNLSTSLGRFTETGQNGYYGVTQNGELVAHLTSDVSGDAGVTATSQDAHYAHPRTATVQFGNVYDLAGDFSFAANPQGAWSYGYAGAPGAEFHPYASKRISDEGFSLWYGTTDNYTPGLLKNETGAPYTNTTHSITWAAGDITLHPGRNGACSVARWTAPAGGAVTFSATFTLIDAQAEDVDIHVLQNNESLYAGTLAGYMGTQTFDQTGPLTVASGDTIDFVVGYGPGGSFLNDTTRVSAGLQLK